MTTRGAVLLLCCSSSLAVAAPTFLDPQFNLPPGFHIYRAAGPDLAGGSYDLCFDGQGRLLVGDGNAVRRLADNNRDGVFDSYEVIATGLGWRGPQGLLVYSNRLYAVGGDGVQLFENYDGPGPLVHRGRIGAKFNTGGDHEAHTLLRGHDGYVYFNTGDGGGAKDRLHITEATSPMLFERAASVFRISPDGTKWECISRGGRNPPNLGQNYLGDFFSFDSDMEWHVSLPWYRPVRLNHWAIGGDQGWQEVGAYPPYFLDCLPGILDVGRGSPDWGVFYEHNQLPPKYANAYLVCDYRWKRESSDDYATTGRLLAFFLRREGAGWAASMEELARPKPGARDENGKPISFALVDIEVAPDGSLYLSDHNQGIWHLTYSDGTRPDTNATETFESLLALPQPASEWSRLREVKLRQAIGEVRVEERLKAMLSDATAPLSIRLRALRLLAPNFSELPASLPEILARDPLAEMRGQAAWLLGIRNANGSARTLLTLLKDDDPFVRRRAAEALTRSDSSLATESLVDHLADPSRLIRFVSMAALAHRPSAEWLDKVELRALPQIRLRGVIAAAMRRENPPEERIRRLITPLFTQRTLVTEDRLDLLRVLVLFKSAFESKGKPQVANYVLKDFPDLNRDIRWEQVRVLGEFGMTQAFGPLLEELESETNHVTQFHIAQALAKLPTGWTPGQEERLIRWLLSVQQGWFAEFSGKGVEFPLFWSTVLTDLGAHHREPLLRELPKIDLSGLLGGVAVNLMADTAESPEQLLSLYRKQNQLEPKLKIIRALKKVHGTGLSEFLRGEYAASTDPLMRGAVIQTLASQPAEPANIPLFKDGLSHKEREVVRASAVALIHYKPEGDESFVRTVLTHMSQRRELFYALERLLVSITGRTPDAYNPEAELNRRPDEKSWVAEMESWKRWYEQRFSSKFEAASTQDRSDDEIYRFLLGDTSRGNAEHGSRIYESLQCHTCHGGGATPGRESRIFGPDLAGVTRRLSRAEFAESLVYPSKQVAERFKAYELERADGTAIVGFVTEQTPEAVTIADQQQVHKVPRTEIKSLRPQSNSLMPDRLLNRLSWEEIRDLLAYLDQFGAVVPNGK